MVFDDGRVDHATVDFALGVEHCTGEPVRQMPPKEAHPDGNCGPLPPYTRRELGRRCPRFRVSTAYLRPSNLVSPWGKTILVPFAAF
jgi:hypothetical protein